MLILAGGSLVPGIVVGQSNPLRDTLSVDDSRRLDFQQEVECFFVTFQEGTSNQCLIRQEVDPLRVDDQASVDVTKTELEGEVIDSGIIIDEGVLDGQVLGEDCSTGFCATRLGICADGCLIPCPRIQWERYTIFSGVNAFTGPLNRGGQGSFGFTEGFNYGRNLSA